MDGGAYTHYEAVGAALAWTHTTARRRFPQLPNPVLLNEILLPGELLAATAEVGAEM
jgi:hypothetical protein